jgi:hypothetical protein
LELVAWWTHDVTQRTCDVESRMMDVVARVQRIPPSPVTEDEG